MSHVATVYQISINETNHDNENENKNKQGLYKIRNGGEVAFAQMLFYMPS